jgi:hypothetical protein
MFLEVPKDAKLTHTLIFPIGSYRDHVLTHIGVNCIVVEGLLEPVLMNLPYEISEIYQFPYKNILTNYVRWTVLDDLKQTRINRNKGSELHRELGNLSDMPFCIPADMVVVEHVDYQTAHRAANMTHCYLVKRDENADISNTISELDSNSIDLNDISEISLINPRLSLEEINLDHTGYSHPGDTFQYMSIDNQGQMGWVLMSEAERKSNDDDFDYRNTLNGFSEDRYRELMLGHYNPDWKSSDRYESEQETDDKDQSND